MDWWQPTFTALTAIIDVLPPEQREKIVDQLQLMAEVNANRGDQQAEYFCRALSGEEWHQPAPKPRNHLKVVK